MPIISVNLYDEAGEIVSIKDTKTPIIFNLCTQYGVNISNLSPAWVFNY